MRAFSYPCHFRSRDKLQSHHSIRHSLIPRATHKLHGSIKHRAMKLAYNMEFSAMADRMVWPPSLSHDKPRATKCTHARVVGLRLKGNLVSCVSAICRPRTSCITLLFYWLPIKTVASLSMGNMLPRVSSYFFLDLKPLTKIAIVLE